jgi:hypothetical protein
MVPPCYCNRLSRIEWVFFGTTFLAARNQTPRFHAGLRAQKADFGQITVKEKHPDASEDTICIAASRGAILLSGNRPGIVG